MNKTGTVAILFLLLVASFPAVSDTIYVLPVHADTGGTAGIRGCVAVTGNSAELFDFPPDRPPADIREISFLSRAFIGHSLGKYARRPVIFTGEGTLYIPELYSRPEHREFFWDLAHVLKDSVSLESDRIEFIFEDPMEELGESAANWKERGRSSTMSVRVLNSGKRAAVEIGEGRKKRTFSVTVRRYMLEPSALRALEPGKEITRSDINVREVEIQRPPYGYMSPEELLTGYTPGRRIRRGDILNQYNTSRRQDIKAGNTITVLAGSGNIQLRLSGTAQSSGRVGDIIPVRPKNGERTVHARIISTQEAVIEDL